MAGLLEDVLGAPPGALRQLIDTKRHASMLELARMMPPPDDGSTYAGADTGEDPDLRFNPHSDPTFCTILAYESEQRGEGLQLQRREGEGWLSVAAEPEQLVVNIGTQLQRLTNDQLAATVHRVVLGTEAARGRQTMSFTCWPAPDRVVRVREPSSRSPSLLPCCLSPRPGPPSSRLPAHIRDPPLSQPLDACVGAGVPHYEPALSGDLDAAVLGLVLTPYRDGEDPSHRQQLIRENKARMVNVRGRL